MPVIEERFRGDLGDIVAVDEWLGDAIDGERDLTAETGSSRKSSLKFCANQLQRRIVHGSGPSWTSRSAASASGSPRPDSRTTRATPCAAACWVNSATACGAPGTEMSGA